VDELLINQSVLGSVQLWLGFILTLIIFSMLLGDHLLARLAQYLFVGTSLGYLCVLVGRHVLLPQLIQPLMANGGNVPELWPPLVLGVMLVLAGIPQIFQHSVSPDSALSRFLRALGQLPLGLILGVALATLLIGAVQGTLMPQFLAASQDELTGRLDGAAITFILTLLITTGALVHLLVEAPGTRTGRRIGGRGLGLAVAIWSWLGKRALWLAAGMIFARLIASYLSLLSARLIYVVDVLRETPAAQILRIIAGGG
jgi:hypothetical protein